MPAYDYIGGDLHPVLGIYDYIANDLHPVILACDYIDNDLHPYFELRKDPEISYDTYEVSNVTMTPTYTQSSSSIYAKVSVKYVDNTTNKGYSYITIWVNNLLAGDTVAFTYTSNITDSSMQNISIITAGGTVLKKTTSDQSNVTHTVTAADEAVGIRANIAVKGGSLGGMGLGIYETAYIELTVKTITVNGTQIFP